MRDRRPYSSVVRKRARKGIAIAGAGHLDARFDKVTIYATDHNRPAVGIDAQVEPLGERPGLSYGKSKGRGWLLATPITAPDSQLVRIHDLNIYGNTNGMATNLLIALGNSDRVREQIADASVRDFSKDYDKVLGKAQRAIWGKQLGNFVLSAKIDMVHHDQIQVTGDGLFTPAVVTGTGQIVLRSSGGEHAARR